MSCQWASTLRSCWHQDAHRSARSRSRDGFPVSSRTVAAGPTCGARVTAWAGTASSVRSVRGAQNGIFCHVVYLVTARDGVLAALARFIAVLFDGLVLAWLPDPKGTATRSGPRRPPAGGRCRGIGRPGSIDDGRGMPEFLVRVSELAD